MRTVIDVWNKGDEDTFWWSPMCCIYTFRAGSAHYVLHIGISPLVIYINLTYEKENPTYTFIRGLRHHQSLEYRKPEMEAN